MSRLKQKLVFGFGVNDAPYSVYKWDNSIRPPVMEWGCPYYLRWKAVLQRCYSNDFKKSRPTYENCICSPEWKYLSNFIKWVDEQPNRDWQNCHLDKDLLGNGKLYSPETCAFIQPSLNTFMIESSRNRGEYLSGVTYRKLGRFFVAECQSPEVLGRKERRYLGRFDTELEAHLAWKAKKHEYACALADLQDDPRVAEALRNRYKPD